MTKIVVQVSTVIIWFLKIFYSYYFLRYLRSSVSILMAQTKIRITKIKIDPCCAIQKPNGKFPMEILFNSGTKRMLQPRDTKAQMISKLRINRTLARQYLCSLIISSSVSGGRFPCGFDIQKTLIFQCQGRVYRESPLLSRAIALSMRSYFRN